MKKKKSIMSVIELENEVEVELRRLIKDSNKKWCDVEELITDAKQCIVRICCGGDE